MSDITNALQSEIRTRIKSIAGTGITEVYDLADTNAVFPYVTLGEIVRLPNHTKDERFCNYTVTLHIWTRSAGSIAAQTIMGAIVDELDNTQLALVDSAPAVYFISSTVIRDPDGATQHGVLRFQVRQ